MGSVIECSVFEPSLYLNGANSGLVIKCHPRLDFTCLFTHKLVEIMSEFQIPFENWTENSSKQFSKSLYLKNTIQKPKY